MSLLLYAPPRCSNEGRLNGRQSRSLSEYGDCALGVSAASSRFATSFAMPTGVAAKPMTRPDMRGVPAK